MYFARRYLLAITTLWAVVFETTRVVLLGFGCGYSLKLCESCMGYIVPLTQKWTPSRLLPCMSLIRPDQAMMFMAGANSIFTGDRLLTTSNPEFDTDKVSQICFDVQPYPCLPDFRECAAPARYEV